MNIIIGVAMFITKMPIIIKSLSFSLIFSKIIDLAKI